MMIEYQGRYMSAEEVYQIRNNPKPVIETIDNQEPTEEIKEPVEVVIEPTEEIKEPVENVTDEFEQAKIKYEELFGRKPSSNIKLETLLDKIAKASEV